MINIKQLSKKEKIILKVYTKYIVKKLLQKSKSNRNIYNSFNSNKIYINNKFILESILNRKNFNQDNYLEFNKYSTLFHNLTYN